jgi:uncharacterized protein
MVFVAIGLLLYVWWPADILHYYGGYMHLALPIIFLPKRYFLWASFGAIIIFHILFVNIPYDTGWNFDALAYKDIWTIKGFIRNTFYTGWNAVFPWVAYFFAGMLLGKLDWSNVAIQQKMFVKGFVTWASIATL